MGGQEQKHFSLLGTKLYFHVNSSEKKSIVLTPNMAALSRGCKPRIGIKTLSSGVEGKRPNFWLTSVTQRCGLCLSFLLAFNDR